MRARSVIRATVLAMPPLILLAAARAPAHVVAAETVPAAGLSQEVAAGEAANIARGAELYARHCLRCHNPRGAAERSDREWIVIMQHMETRANLTRRNARSVLAFLLASHASTRLPGTTSAPLAPTPGVEEIDDTMLAAGRQVFQGAGVCAACHGKALEGTAIAPNLKDGVWKNGDGSLPAILDVIRKGVPGTAMAPYPGGITDQMAVQASAFVWAVSQGRIRPE